MSTLGLILARGGSRRVPRKNIRPLGGMPLMAWSIAAGQHAGSIDAVVVSSEDDEILKVAVKHGAEPLLRPHEMATDEASSYMAMLHAMKAFNFDVLCLLQPTSPFRQPGDIDGCYDRLSDNVAAVSVEIGKTVPNGAVYMARSYWLLAALANGDPAPFDGIVPIHYMMPAERSLDIDTEQDFARAEGMLQREALI